MKHKTILSLVAAVAPQWAHSQARTQADLTKSELFKDCHVENVVVPERREYPINATINPCNDLYNYACSQTLENFDLPKSRSGWYFAYEADELFLCAKKKYLSELDHLQGLTTRSESLKTFYSACMNSNASTSEEKRIVAQEVERIDAIKSIEDFKRLSDERIDGPDFGFVGFDTMADLNKPDWNDVVFQTNVMTLPEPSYYEKPEVVADLQKLIESFFEAVGLDHAADRAKSVIDYEKAFAKTYPLPDDLRQRWAQHNETSPSKLTALYPNIPFDRVLKRFPATIVLQNVFPQSLAFVNSTFDNSHLETLKNVQLYHSLSSVMDDAYPEYFAKKFAFNKKHLGGPEKRPDRQERCTKSVMSSFNMELDSELIPILFPNFPKESVTRLSEAVRKAIVEGLKENSWLSANAKSVAIRKMSQAKLFLIQPRNDREWNFNPVAKYDPQAPIANSRLLDKNLLDKKVRELYQPRDHTRWDMNPLLSNAYYDPSDNKFVLPLGTLLYPWFDDSLSWAANMGAIGSTVGHELNHGIDDIGSKFDEKGRLRSWMNAKDQEKFHQRADKIAKQFDKAGFNGSLTLGENLADLNGLIASYKAAFPKNKGAPSDKREFFVSYARTWCEKQLPGKRLLQIKTNEHATGDARTNEVVKNMPGFAEAFSCKSGDALFTPSREQARIW